MRPFHILASTLTLLGDTGDWRDWISGTLLIGVGGAGSFVVAQLWKLRNENREVADKKEKSIVDHKDALIERLDADKKEKDARIKELERKVERLKASKVNCEVRDVAKLQWIKYQERVLASQNIPFEKYVDPAPIPDDESNGSTEHQTLAPTDNTTKGS